jgi:hypothetical protein
VRKEKVIKAVLNSEELATARREIEGGYWGLPEDTQKSVMGNVRNYLVPFTAPEIAEVFCDKNTFDLREVESGKVVCVAMPQKFAVQRRYVAAIMKNIIYQLGLNRFDLRKDQSAFKNRNCVIVDSDEHQISAGAEDQRVDVTREANYTLYAASQSRNALWKAYGGKEASIPILGNLRNLWACQAATEDCAKETATIIAKIAKPEKSYSSGDRSSVSTSYKEKPIVSESELMLMEPFYVYWVPAEGKWLFKKLIAMPVTPDCKIPHWWFGELNPLRWVIALLCKCGLPDRYKIGKFSLRIHDKDTFVWPWRGHAKAPWRAQWHYLLGFDGTFITIEKMTRKHALKKVRAPYER